MPQSVDLTSAEIDFDFTAPFYQYRTPYGEAFFHEMNKRLNFTSQSRILDIACGSGELSLGVSPYVGKVVGFDFSREMLSRAPASPNVEYRFHDLQNGPFLADAGFDVVLIGRAIPYLPASTLEPTLDKALNPGGKVLVCGGGFHKSTPWYGYYHKLKDKYRSYFPEMGQFEGTDKMKSMQFELQPVDSFTVMTDMTFTLDYLAKNIASFQSCTQKILANKEGFEQDLLSYFQPYCKNGVLTGRVASWANVFAR